MNTPKNYMLLILFVTLSFVVFTVHANESEVVFLTWAEYLDEEIVAEFEQKYGIKVKIVYYESDDDRDDLLIQTNGQGYDIILASGSALYKYRKQKWMAPLNTNMLPNMKYIDKKWIDIFQDAKGYAVPYFWGTNGIAYREDLVAKKPVSWRDLFQPEEHEKGKISMIRSSRDMFGMSLKMLGYSMNSNNKNEIDEAYKVLEKQKPFVKSYSYIRLDDKSALVKGQVSMSFAYNGDALSVMEHDKRIKYITPKEGVNLWVDYLFISSSSKNSGNAYKFINYLNEPKVSAKNAEYTYCATPNLGAVKYLPKGFLDNEVIYPSSDVLRKSEIYTKLNPRVARIRTMYFTKITD